MARLRMYVDADDDRQVQAALAEFARRYERWFRARNPQARGAVDVTDLELLLDWKIRYEDGQLDRWTKRDVEAFLLGWCPRKLSVPADMAHMIPEGVAAAFDFLAGEGLLSPASEGGVELAAHARSLAPRFIDRMSDPANFGMAKSLFASLDGAEPTRENLDSMMAAFNALPYEQRAAITDPLVSGIDDLAEPPPGEPPSLGPILLPDTETIRASAAAAPVLAGFAAMADYFSPPGRPLTARGNIRLADAESLAEVLGSEGIEEHVGGTTFRRRSATQMPELDHWQWWAREAGALRVRNKRMVGVTAWRDRMRKDPLAEARKAFLVLVDHGVTTSYHAGRSWGVSEVTDMLIAPVMAILLSSPGPMGFSGLVDVTEQVRADAGAPLLFDSPGLTDTLLRRDLALALRLLERAGALILSEAVYEESAYSSDLVEAAVELTPFGIVMAVEWVEDAGFDVTTIDSATELTAATLAGMALTEQVGVEHWWSLVSSWAEGQPDRRGSIREVLDSIAGHSALLFALEADPPATLHGDVQAVLREAWDTRSPTDPLAAAGIGWLGEHGHIAPTEVDPDDLLAAHVSVLAIAAAEHSESILDILGTDAPREVLLTLVERASGLMPPGVESFLEALGRHYPDKVVAKSARRELMRVRSRLANQRRN